MDKVKSFSILKDTINVVKTQIIDWRKIFKLCTVDKEL